jgi:hypothetical protein
MRRALIGAGILAGVFVGGTRMEAQTIKMDVPAGLVLSTTNEPAPKKESKSKPDKGIFKELRPGSCRPTTFSAPVSSWPARGEPLVAVCRP